MVFSRKLCYWLIALTILVNLVGLAQPLLRNDDPLLYANIAKHIVLTNNWIDLISGGQDWLDKPHLPFWLTAVSFKLFGINSFSYILPGLLFSWFGAFYCYRLARLIYNQDCALISVLIYLTSLHLLISAYDVRAEAYLLGQIMPACYYYLLYDRNSRLKNLLLGSFFTALAMVTKGLFVVIVIFSGLVFTWAYTRQLKRLISCKWLFAYILCLFFILPELISLYLQFDAHPDKIVFGQQHVSGLAWYFWGSQFGRFFNSGPIVNTHGNPFFFIHTYLWSFLPWTLVFIASIYNGIKIFKINNQIERAKIIYLAASFWLSFILFSATKFQLDHYTNIIMPFAAIYCANYLVSHGALVKLACWQKYLSLALLVLCIVFCLYLFQAHLASLFILLCLIGIILIVKYQAQLSYLMQCIIWPSLAINLVMLFLFLINYVAYRPYDVGYNLAKIINQQPLSAVYDYQTHALPLEFYSQTNYFNLEKLSKLPMFGSYYLVMSEEHYQANLVQLVRMGLNNYAKFCGNTIDKIMPYYARKTELAKHLQCYVVLRHYVS